MHIWVIREKNLQGLKSWAWLPRFCRTFGVRVQQVFYYWNPPGLLQRARGPFGPGSPKESEKSPKGCPGASGPGPGGPGVPKECAPESEKSPKRVRSCVFGFLKKRSENAGANENLSGGFAAIPGPAPRVAPRIVGFVLLKSWEAIPRMEFRIGISNSESCSENTPELSESSEKMAFSLRERFSWNWGGPQASDFLLCKRFRRTPCRNPCRTPKVPQNFGGRGGARTRLLRTGFSSSQNTWKILSTINLN